MNNRLHKFKFMYQNVKNERNSLVTLIQITTQDRSELKNKFKTYDRQLFLLQSTKSEKEKILKNIKKQISEMKIIKNKFKKENNFLEISKKGVVKANVRILTEISKLSRIVKSIDKEIVLICHKIDSYCLQRNCLGQNLFDINEELVYFFDIYNLKKKKNNVRKNNSNNLNHCIQILEYKKTNEENQLYFLKEKKKKLPGLSKKIIILNEKLMKEKKIENLLSEKLENYEKDKLLKINDDNIPSDKILNSKFKIIKTNLNKIKEKFLQNEIVLEEIIKINLNMKKITSEKRQNSLKCMEKSNFLKNKYNKIIKKIMTLVSELSLYQAKFFKIKLQKNNLLEKIDKIQDRIHKNLPPNLDSEIKFLDKIKKKKIFQENFLKKKEKEIFCKYLINYVTKTKGEKRFDSYFDQNGFPRPYGVFKPFKGLAPITFEKK